MNRILRWVTTSLAILVATVWALNTPRFAPKFSGSGPELIAHRGVHQDFDRTGLTNQTCTAARTVLSGHTFLENTIPSMTEAFNLGASVVELDIHLTADNKLAVFHDWTLDCRTDGTGETRKATMADLKALDVGYGYTANGGRTFPFRGTGTGLMPSLPEVMVTFPDRLFLIDIKSNDPRVGERLADLLVDNPAWRKQVWGVYGGQNPVAEVGAAHPEIRTFTRRTLKACLTRYLLLGWSGYMPKPCRGETLYLPVNYTGWFWGWPNRFVERVHKHDGRIVLIGPHHRGNVGSRGLDTARQLQKVPAAFPGYIQTDRVEVIAPLLSRPVVSRTRH